MLASRTGGNISGNRVRTSIRMARAKPVSGGLRYRGELLAGGRIDTHAPQQALDRVAGLRANAQPVVDAISLEIQLFVVGGNGIEPAELFDHSSVTRRSLVDGIEPEEGAIGPAHSLQTQHNHAR